MLRGSRVRLPHPRDRVKCDFAENFSSWTETLLEKTNTADRVQLHQAILQLTLQYYQWYMRVPQAHQTRVGPKGHSCIFHVFMDALDSFMSVRDALDPPVYVPPPPPPQIERIVVEKPYPVIPSFSDQGTLLGLDD